MQHNPNNQKQFEQYLIGFIRLQKWKYATTYDKSAPHEYILMEWNEKLFRDIGDYIAKYGEDTFYYKASVRYGYIGNYRYWHYSTYEIDSVLNRALNRPEHMGMTNYSKEIRAKYMKIKYISGVA